MLPQGIPVIADPYWPKNKPVIGTFTSRAHPLVEWLAKWFPFDPNTYFENVEIEKTWNDPIMMFGKIHMSMEQFSELKNEIRKQDFMMERNALTNGLLKGYF